VSRPDSIQIPLVLGPVTVTLPNLSFLADFTTDSATGNSGVIVYVDPATGNPDDPRDLELVNMGGTLAAGIDRYRFVGRLFRSGVHWLLFERVLG